ncbi:30S ribosomal protein S5 [Metamycoplasma phocicerebrale]|uniref:Small ribosomal subunit protein uS5 n=1 Tax=Metamycoplasma phocicerebrale TaxID=142649 RepID=A0A3Q9V381_9BACT|nr:30S ribosomal protein S5 [Metamycoplasma phocicerebrale]
MAEEIKKEEAEKTNATKVVSAVKKQDKKENSKSSSERKTFSPRRQLNSAPAKIFEEKVIDIARVTTVVKGGRRFSFSAYVVVGDKKGKVGFGHGKANEVQDAIKKAVKDAQKNIFSVPIVNGTIPHEIREKFLASKVQLRPAPKGTGIVASNTVRAVIELAGYTDISTKTYGSRTKQNIIHATVNALKKIRTVEEIAKLRDIDVKHLLAK